MDMFLSQEGCRVSADHLFCCAQGVKLETFCDDEWWESQVVELKNDRVRIHYVGGEEDEDEWIPISSGRLRPPEVENSKEISGHSKAAPKVLSISESHHSDFYDCDQRPVRRSRLTSDDARLAFQLQKEEVKAARGQFPETRKRGRPQSSRPAKVSKKVSASGNISKDLILAHLSETKAIASFKPLVNSSSRPPLPKHGDSASSQRLISPFKGSASSVTFQKLYRASEDQSGMVSFLINPCESKDHILPPLKRSRMCLTEDFTIGQVKRLIIDEILPEMCTAMIELRTPCGALVGQDHTLKYVRTVQWPRSRGDLVLQYSLTKNQML
jgi:hypothetical protein